MTLGPTAIGRGRLVRKKVDVAGIEPLDIGIEHSRIPAGMKGFVAAHRQIELRTLDTSWEDLHARSTLISWFTETPRGTLMFETFASGHRLGAVGEVGRWDKDIGGFLDALLEFRALLNDVLNT